MNASQSLLVAIALTAAAAAPVFAQQATPDTWLQTLQSSTTRADVSAALAADRQLAHVAGRALRR